MIGSHASHLRPQTIAIRYYLSMPRRTLSFARTIPMIGLAVVIVAVAGCGGSGGSGGSGGGLESALSRVADTAANRSEITYDNTAVLVQLAGKSLTSTKGFAELRGWGASAVADEADLLPGEAGFNLLGENYSISAGSPPKILSLMSGGQSASEITSHLTSLGWKRSAGKLVAPPPLTANSQAAVLAFSMAQVQPVGSDVVFGGSGASLGQIGSPQGATLASDPSISALAQCLGNVVAATIVSGGYLGGKKPAALAVGITQPASNTATPHAVACVSWSSQADATAYATDVRQALTKGISAVDDEPFSTILTHASVTTIGGGQHVVEWQADTQNAQTVFVMVDDIGLPALPDCERLPAYAIARFVGCV
jgi:hypothetical protein